MDQRFDRVDHRLDGAEAEIRGAWVVLEDLRGQIKLVAEGVTNNNERLERHSEEVSRRFDDLESLVHRSYDDLDERVSRLEAAS